MARSRALEQFRFHVRTTGGSLLFIGLLIASFVITFLG